MDKQLDQTKLFLQPLAPESNGVEPLFSQVTRDFGRFAHIPRFMMRSAMKKGILHAVLLTDGMEEFGYAIYQYVPDYEGIHIIYLAINPSYRSHGLGGLLLERLNASFPAGLLLEVEDPEHAKNDEDALISHRRIAFYERNGLHLKNGVKLSNFGHPLLLMTSQELPELNEQQFRTFYQTLCNRVYRLPLLSLAVKVTYE
ncbi:GNAT family N-acetyltransferase [Sporosarcina sp. PTS2304]|uniref:GNAT family N-acetyltransferase n=1 Tax=Sporosarcina sp. PTS2304 TaxID=2283194 RepID=UPI000E0DB7DA|nr:GNAT family N-acetyltransferase [Sporosarcina sp. PTS2304]AXI01022.1 GNAT family N-acetyltransferase [Sporosarcina sp. PTS2304]